VPQDYAEAVTWYRKAAVQGDEIANFKMGIRTCLGQGVRKDDAAGAAWIRVAADKNFPKAQSTLGSLYEEGRGVPQDDVAAHMWFSAASVNGDTSAEEHKVRIAARLTEKQKAESHALYWEFLERKVEQSRSQP
jgi:TPR repeat protein